MSQPTRREFLKQAGALTASAGLFSAWPGALQAAGGRRAERRPNILLLFPDQHRFDWLGVNPAVPVRTPNLDALGRRGARFTAALCPAPVCAPSRACLASGKEYDRCRVASNGVNYPLDQTTFYTLLRQSGYHVMGCGKFDLAKPMNDWGLDGKRLLPEWGFSDGINNEGKWDAINSGSQTPKGPYMAYLQNSGLLDVHVADFQKRRDKSAAFPTTLPEDAYCDNWLAANGLKLLAEAPPGKPWFLQVNFTGPHSPWDITQRMERSCRGLTGFPPPNGCRELDPETHVRIRQNYSAMVENIDRWVGIYLNELGKRGELENTLVAFSSDHGEMLGDHDRWSKSVPYQPSAGVPLIVSGPGVRRQFVFDGPAATLDLAATFLRFAGLPVPDDMQSRSLKRLLEGGTDSHREVVFSGLGNWRLVFDGRYKLVKYLPGGRRKKQGQTADRQGGVRYELYDLKNDPLENVDVAPTAQGKVAELKRVLEEHLSG